MSHEELRLAALESYLILDTPFERDFDDIVKLAAHICGTPIALISLIDRDRQWFKAAHGLELRETSRDISFCKHTIEGEGLFVVPDATKDDRFKSNPLVEGQTNVKFYAGAPIQSDEKFGMGSLCVIDHQPRQLTAQQEECLRMLSHHVTVLLEKRKQSMRLQEISTLALNSANRSDLEFRSIFDSLAIGVVQVSPVDGAVLRSNRTYREMLGYGEEEITGRLVRTMVHPDDRERVNANVKRIVSGEDHILQQELRYVSKDGGIAWVRTTDVLVSAPDGSPLHITGVVQDITSEHSAKTEMALHKEALALATNAANIGVWDWDMLQNVITMNENQRDLYGARALILPVEDIFSQVLPDDIEKLKAEIEFTRKHRQPYKSDFRIRHSSGEIRTLLAAGSMLYNSQGEAYRMVGINIDVTESRRAEIDRAYLEIQAQSAVESSRLKSEFLANMSHEIRTPINGIIGMTRLLQETQLNDDQKRFAGSIANSSTILLTLINDILDLSKVESGKLDLEVVPFNARRMVTGLQSSFETLFNEKGLRLEIAYNADEDYFAGDQSRLIQILNNLIGNALKFTKTGHVRVEVKDGLTFSVADTGIGMSEKVCNNLFQKFSQGDASTARKFGGTGLGLAISKQLCQLMGGDIAVESREGKGTTFTFLVSLRKATADEIKMINTDLPLLSASLPKSAREKFRILVAEDNIINQEITLRGLMRAGYRATAVANGLEVLTSIVSVPCDLILMDCQMPEMDGFEATRQLRKNGFKIPIVALTANAFHEDKERCLEAGMNEYLSKPVRDDLLIATVDRVLGAAAQQPPAGTTSVPNVEVGSALNMNQLRELQILDPDGKDGFVQNLIQIYLESSAKSLIEIETADAAKRVKLAHALKSTSANLGAMKVAAILKAIEFGKFEDAELRAQLAALRRELELACGELRSYADSITRSRAS